MFTVYHMSVNPNEYAKKLFKKRKKEKNFTLVVFWSICHFHSYPKTKLVLLVYKYTGTSAMKVGKSGIMYCTMFYYMKSHLAVK